MIAQTAGFVNEWRLQKIHTTFIDYSPTFFGICYTILVARNCYKHIHNSLPEARSPKRASSLSCKKEIFVI